MQELILIPKREAILLAKFVVEYGEEEFVSTCEEESTMVRMVFAYARHLGIEASEELESEICRFYPVEFKGTVKRLYLTDSQLHSLWDMAAEFGRAAKCRFHKVERIIERALDNANNTAHPAGGIPDDSGD